MKTNMDIYRIIIIIIWGIILHFLTIFPFRRSVVLNVLKLCAEMYKRWIAFFFFFGSNFILFQDVLGFLLNLSLMFSVVSLCNNAIQAAVIIITGASPNFTSATERESISTPVFCSGPSWFEWDYGFICPHVRFNLTFD